MRHRRPITIGLTGSLASGKSTALKVFKRSGWKVSSADDLVAEIYKKKGLTKADILKKFGATEQGLRRLEKWVHPLVRTQVAAFIKMHQRHPIIVEVPLLYEAQFERLFDMTVFIFSPRAIRRVRALKRGMSAKLFDTLDGKQMKPSEKALRADFVLLNLEKKSFKKQAKELSKLLQKK